LICCSLQDNQSVIFKQLDGAQGRGFSLIYQVTILSYIGLYAIWWRFFQCAYITFLFDADLLHFLGIFCRFQAPCWLRDGTDARSGQAESHPAPAPAAGGRLLSQTMLVCFERQRLDEFRLCFSSSSIGSGRKIAAGFLDPGWLFSLAEKGYSGFLLFCSDLDITFDERRHTVITIIFLQENFLFFYNEEIRTFCWICASPKLPVQQSYLSGDHLILYWSVCNLVEILPVCLHNLFV
jgi:hypothetical protein